MEPRRRRIAVISSLVAITGAVLVTDLYVRHRNDSGRAIKPITASTTAAPDVSAVLTQTLQQQGVPLDGVTVTWVEGIVILRGTTASKETGDQIAAAVRTAGYSRVANMLQVSTAPNDDAIKRDAERKLTLARGLNGCKFSVTANNGILKVGGVVPSDVQEAAAREILKNVRGPREVHAEFRRF